MPDNSNATKGKLLGMPYGTACHRLRKSVMLHLLKKFGLNICYRCDKAIETERELSVEHTVAWQSAPDPVATFFDVSTIAFSHLSCNCSAATPTIKFAKPGEIWCYECQTSKPYSEFAPARIRKRRGPCRKCDVGPGRPERRKRGLTY